jgi:glycerol-3-phosphate dehydrogenase
MIVNAAGHWVDTMKDMIFANKPAYLRRTKGVHIMIPRISTDALVLFSPDDGRLFFVIPWREFSLVGTTDTDYKENLDAVFATAADVKYILDGLHFAYPDVKTEDILYAYAGLRSLALKPGKSASNTSRSHELIDHSKTDKLDGLVTILGGKITAYRAVARDATDLVCKKMGNKARCVTGEKPLPGAPELNDDEIKNLAAESGLPHAVVSHLSQLYGSRCREVIAIAKEDASAAQQISAGGPDILAQVRHAVKSEVCMTVNDFMVRRSIVGFRKDQGADAVAAVAKEMQRLLNWTEEEKDRQIQTHNFLSSLGQRFRNP